MALPSLSSKESNDYLDEVVARILQHDEEPKDIMSAVGSKSFRSVISSLLGLSTRKELPNSPAASVVVAASRRGSVASRLASALVHTALRARTPAPVSAPLPAAAASADPSSPEGSGISKEYANVLQRELQQVAMSYCSEDLDAYWPPVVFSYATGSRFGIDEAGAGPGLVDMVRIQMVCFNVGIRTYSGLTLPTGCDWEVFKLRIAERGQAKALVLVALLSKAFYRSIACLEEVHRAVEHDIPVIPVRMEEDLPDEQGQWPEVDSMATNMRVKLMKAQESLGTNAIPPRGVFVIPEGKDSRTTTMDALLDELRKHTQAKRGANR